MGRLLLAALTATFLVGGSYPGQGLAPVGQSPGVGVGSPFRQVHRAAQIAGGGAPAGGDENAGDALAGDELAGDDAGPDTPDMEWRVQDSSMTPSVDRLSTTVTINSHSESTPLFLYKGRDATTTT